MTEAAQATRPLRRVDGIVAPLDRQAGGTWWGLNVDGVFAALTNRPAASQDASRRSRGLLVADALRHGSADAAASALGAVAPDAYNPFNLYVADREKAFAIVYDRAPALWPLEPGVHVIGNADPNARDVAGQYFCTSPGFHVSQQCRPCIGSRWMTTSHSGLSG